MRTRFMVAIAVACMLCLSSIAEAQRPGQGQGQGQPRQGGRQGGRQFGGGGFGGFGGVSRLALLRIDAVKKELELLDDQVAAIQKLEEEMRASRPQFGRGQGTRGQGTRGNRGGAGGAPRRPAAQDGTFLQFAPGQYFVQQPGQRGRPELTEEQRARMAEFRKQMEERQKQENEKLAAILLPHQMKRLNEIYVQQLGIAALQNAEIAGKLKITDEQKKKMEEINTANREEIGSQVRALFQGGQAADRDQIREKMTALRKKAEEKVMDVLTGAQKKEFEEMKGKPFEMPEGALRGGGRGGNRGGNRGGGNRPAPDA